MKINLCRIKASVICKPGLYRARDIGGKAGLICHAYCKTVGRNEHLISWLRLYQNSPYNVSHIGRLLEKLSNFPLLPTRLQTSGTARLISSPHLLPTMPFIFFDCFYEPSLQVFRSMVLFQEAPVLVCEIYMI